VTTAAHHGGRNAACACGSGRKARRCHPRNSTASIGATAPVASAEVIATRLEHRIAALVARAEVDLAASRFEAAVTGGKAILGLDPSNADAHGLLGLVAHRHEQFELAVDYMLAGLVTRPANALLRRRLAAVLTDVGLIDDAIGQLELAIAAEPDDPSALADLAAIHLRTGGLDLAGGLYQRALVLDPANLDALLGVVFLDMAAERRAEAHAGFERLLALADRPSAHLVATGAVTSVRDWCSAEAPGSYTIVKPAGALTIARPRYAGDVVQPAPLEVVRPERYLAMLDDATAIGGETVVLASDGSILFDIAAHPDAERYDLVRGAVRYIDRRSALIHAGSGPVREIEAGLLLTGGASHNYYHWLLEFLTRFQTIQSLPGLDELPLLVDRASMRVPQMAETLAIVAGSRRRRIALESGQPVRVGRLAIASPGAWLPHDLRDGLLLEARDSIVDPDAIQFLRDRLTPADVDRERPGTRRIHLARSRVGRLRNEKALAPVLAEFGFASVLPEDLSFANQARLFADADVIVAESGAALVNLIFAPPSARIVVLGADRWDLTLFSQLAGALGQELIYVAGSPIAGSHLKLYQSRFTLEPASLRSALAEFLGAPA
jgi:capsular polysaccharide biosynthesis protein/Tfp pilus assembly protein PilF